MSPSSRPLAGRPTTVSSSSSSGSSPSIGTTGDPEIARIWKHLVETAKAEMHSGATVRDPMSGASDPAPRHLHTDGAHKLATQGVTMLAAAGWNEFRFDDC